MNDLHQATRAAVTTTARLLDGLSPEEKEELEAGLARRGWKFALASRKRRAGGVSGGILTAAIAYREYNGLGPAADGAAILKALRRPCCGLPDDTRLDPETGRPRAAAIEFGRWDRDFEVTYAYRFRRTPDGGDSLAAAQVRAAFEALARATHAHCGLRVKFTEDFDRANVYCIDHARDGQHGVLADMMLPGPGVVGAGHRCQGRFDWGEAWGLRTRANPDLPHGRAIDFMNVLWHEFLHALGLGHTPGSGQEVMNPMYWPAPHEFVAGPWLGPRDTGYLQGAYGPPRQAPPPPPPPPPPGDPDAAPILELDGRLAGALEPLAPDTYRFRGFFAGRAAPLGVPTGAPPR